MIRDDAVQTVFQPIVDLVTGEVVAHEALARGPEGPLQSPAALFGAARTAGLLAELDRACLTAALRAARARFTGPATVFVNVEPEVLDFSPSVRSREPPPTPRTSASCWRSPSGPWPRAPRSC